MRPVPDEDEVTLCEVNCKLLTVRSKDDPNWETFRSLQVVQFPEIKLGEGIQPQVTRVRSPVVRVEPNAEEVVESGERSQAEQQRSQAERVLQNASNVGRELGPSIWQTAASYASSTAGSVVSWWSSVIGKAVDSQSKLSDGSSGVARAMAWHPHQLRLAICPATADPVLLYDLEQASSSPATLVHKLQREVTIVAWRPHAAATVAVGCREGVCLWQVSLAGGAMRRRGRTADASMEFLHCFRRLQVTALCWSPCGRLLATASVRSPTIVIWDVSCREAARVRQAFAGIHLLEWSPQGDYLISGHVDGTFRIWETRSWTSEKWSNGGALVSVQWAPDGRMALLAVQSLQLGALHFSRDPPALEALLLPLEFTELAVHFSDDTGKCQLSAVRLLAWDRHGDRLAVAFSGSGVGTEVVALYQTRHTPVVTTLLIGYIRGPRGAKPSLLAFQSDAPKGAVLAVCWTTGLVTFYPLFHRGV
eukprot:jgi/Chlat1/1968/Chrsp158S02280